VEDSAGTDVGAPADAKLPEGANGSVDAALPSDATVDAVHGPAHMVVDLLPGPASSYSVPLGAAGDRVVFRAYLSGMGADPSIMSSDGTAAGTLALGVPSNAWPYTPGGGLMYLDAPITGATALWRTDGTPTGTVMLADAFASWVTGGAAPKGFTFALGRWFFSAEDLGPGGTSAHGYEPWTSDGTPAGTAPLGDLAPGPASSVPGPFLLSGDRVLFSARDEAGHLRLWSTDGTTGGTLSFFDLPAGTMSVTVAGSSLYYLTRSPYPDGSTLWRTALTAGAAPVEVYRFQPTWWPFLGLGTIGNLVFFTVEEHHDWRSVWRTDGTTAGTYPVGSGEIGPLDAVVLGGELFYVMDDGSLNRLWRTDGTPATQVIAPDGHAIVRVARLAVLGGAIYFEGDVVGTDYHGALWRVAPAGAFAVEAVRFDRVPGYSRPTLVVAAGGHVFFRAGDPQHGVELWVFTP
jgi:ELWxxDGT repeat protein